MLLTTHCIRPIQCKPDDRVERVLIVVVVAVIDVIHVGDTTGPARK